MKIIEENAIGKKTSHSYGKTKPSSDKEPFIYSSKEILKDYDLEHTLNKYSDKLKNESDSPTYLDSPGKILTYMLKAQHSLTSRTYNPKGVAVFRRSEVESLMSSLKISRIIA